MVHRSALVLALALAFAAPAHAAGSDDERSFAVPADAPTVATTPSGGAVLAWVRGAALCTVVQKPGAPRPARAANLTGVPGREDVAPGQCDKTPVLPRFGADGSGDVQLDDQRGLIWGTAGADAATVLFKVGARVVAQAATTTAPLAGAAAGVRFWAVETRSTDAVDEIAVADAASVVRQAYDPARLGPFPDLADNDPDERSGTLIRQGRVGAMTWQLRRVTTSTLAATPLQPERHVRQECLLYVTRAEHAGSSGGGPCADAVEHTPMVASTGVECGLGAHVEAVAAASVRRVVVVTGDGARRSVPLSRFTAGTRAGTLPIGRRLAIRRVVALGADGRTLAAQDVSLAPAGAGDESACASTGLTFSGFGPDDRPLGHGPHVARFVDHGVELCDAVDRAPRIPEDCSLPPTDPTETRVSPRPTSTGRFVYGIVPAEIASARVTLDDHTIRAIAAQPLTGYPGIYAGVLREIAADLPGPHVVDRIELLDEHGRVLNADAGTEVARGPAVTVLPAADGLPAVRAVPLRDRRFEVTCLVLGQVSDRAGCDGGVLEGLSGARSLDVTARCSPRRLLVSALLAHREDRLVVKTTDGREVAARVTRLPASAGAAAAGKFYALVALRPSEGVDSAIVRGRTPRRVTLDLPPTGRQCGYSAQPGALLGFLR